MSSIEHRIGNRVVENTEVFARAINTLTQLGWTEMVGKQLHILLGDSKQM
jgi:hypothetical protein